MDFLYKAKTFRTTAFFPQFKHTAFYFPPFVETNGFETTDCLECLQILDVLYMAGRSALKLETGYCVSYLDIVFQNGKRAVCFPFLSFCILAFYQNTIRKICPSASYLSFHANVLSSFSLKGSTGFRSDCLNYLMVWLARWWKIESSMLEHRKAEECYIYPL